MKQVKSLSICVVPSDITKLEAILETYWSRPDIHLKQLCKKHKLDFNYYMNELLDYYNLCFKEVYKTNGEDATLPALKKQFMKEALYHVYKLMAYDYRKSKKRKMDMDGYDWYEYGIGS